MMGGASMRTGLVVVSLLTSIAGVAHADDHQRARLPGVRLSRPGQPPVSSAVLARPVPWVLVYSTPACTPCLHLLNATGKDEGIDPSRITVIVAPEPGPMPRHPASRIEWPADRVYVDDRGAFASQLQLPGAPMMLGLLGDEIHWQWSGTLPADSIRSIVNSWLTSRPVPTGPGPLKR